MTPAYLLTVSRPQLCGRVHALREALEILRVQSLIDRKGACQSVAAIKNELAMCEQRLRDVDARWPHGAPTSPAAESRLRAVDAHQAPRHPFPDCTTEGCCIGDCPACQARRAGQPFAAAVTSQVATDRLRNAGADLAELVRTIAFDSARAMSNVAARHRAHALEDTARIRETAELNRIPSDELLELAPDTARELARNGGAE